MSQDFQVPTSCRVVHRFRDYSHILNAAFKQICNTQDWKAPIECLVPWDTANVYMEAISHMTATVASCERVTIDGRLYAYLKAEGYRAGPAGDH